MRPSAKCAPRSWTEAPGAPQAPKPPRAPRWSFREPFEGLWFSRTPRRLGIQYQEIGEQLAGYFKLAGNSGVLVTHVDADGPAAKGGLKLLTQNMCCEWARYNINVNGIGPGYIATAQTAPIRVDGHPFNDLIMTRTPAGRWGEPEELAGAAILLASEAGRFINGQIIYVDGGILANFGYVKGENDV